LYDFYAPIIGYASIKTRDLKVATKHLYEVLVSKFFLAEETTIHAKSDSKTAWFVRYNGGYELYEVKEGAWYSFFDQVWEDYKKLMEKYSKLIILEIPNMEKPD